MGLVHFVDNAGRSLRTAALDAAVSTGDILIVERQVILPLLEGIQRVPPIISLFNTTATAIKPSATGSIRPSSALRPPSALIHAVPPATYPRRLPFCLREHMMRPFLLSANATIRGSALPPHSGLLFQLPESTTMTTILSLTNKETHLAVVGLGYVGLPLAVALNR